MPNGLIYLNFLDRSVSSKKSVWLVFIITIVYRNSYTKCKQCRPWSDAASAALIFVYTVFQSLFYKTLGINGLNWYKFEWNNKPYKNCSISSFAYQVLQLCRCVCLVVACYSSLLPSMSLKGYAFSLWHFWVTPFDPAHDKTYNKTCAPSEDSNQPGHPPSLIRVFAVRMKKAWVLS